jgi:hypothetical protein
MVEGDLDAQGGPSGNTSYCIATKNFALQNGVAPLPLSVLYICIRIPLSAVTPFPRGLLILSFHIMHLCLMSGIVRIPLDYCAVHI